MPSASAAVREGAPDRATIVRAMRELYSGPAWHGPSVRAALRGVTAELASRASSASRNTIWALTLHLAYSRFQLMHRLETDPIDRFPRRLRKAWWPELPEELTPATWRADLKLLDDYQTMLIASVQRAPAARLARVRSGQRRTLAHELLGGALHDAYHAGQIKLIASAFSRS
jgi:DinB family protein